MISSSRKLRFVVTGIDVISGDVRAVRRTVEVCSSFRPQNLVAEFLLQSRSVANEAQLAGMSLEAQRHFMAVSSALQDIRSRLPVRSPMSMRMFPDSNT